MNKEEKIGILLSILLIISIIFVFNMHNISNDHISNTSNANIKTMGNNNINNTNNNNNTIIPKSNFSVQNVCEGCHLSGKGSIPQASNVQPHLNGGNYCLICHNFSHDKHPINNNVTCEKCHGSKNETIPVSGPKIVCINCHDYPNPLNKSFGNILSIHEPRGISCINCHADRCTNCHKEMGNDTRWEKRIIHFKTILGNSSYENK
jgi:hypothetical protein